MTMLLANRIKAAAATQTVELEAKSSESSLFDAVLAATEKSLAEADKADKADKAPKADKADKARKPRKAAAPKARKATTAKARKPRKAAATPAATPAATVVDVDPFNFSIDTLAMPVFAGGAVATPAAQPPVKPVRKPRKARAKKSTTIANDTPAARVERQQAAAARDQTLPQRNALKALRRKMIKLNLSIRGTKSRGLNYQQAQALIERLTAQVEAAMPRKVCPECGLPIGNMGPNECQAYTA